MFEAEAIRIREILLAHGAPSPLLNLGSSTGAFRRVAKPHIERELFAPLAGAGVVVVHSDLKRGEGVDLAGDILDPAVRRGLLSRRFRCVLVSNLLEHVRDRDAVASACEEIAGPGGLVLATVPSSFPYHADPIDTLYRPSPSALASLFGGSRPLLAEEVVGRSYGEDLKARGSTLRGEIGRTLAKGLLAFARPRSFASQAHRWLWFSRPYRVSVALVEVQASGESASQKAKRG